MDRVQAIYANELKCHRLEVREIVGNVSWDHTYPSDAIAYTHWDAVRKAVEFITGLTSIQDELWTITAMRDELGWYCESDQGDLITVEIVENEV